MITYCIRKAAISLLSLLLVLLSLGSSYAFAEDFPISRRFNIILHNSDKRAPLSRDKTKEINKVLFQLNQNYVTDTEIYPTAQSN
jgi:hypothetical protein